MYPGRMSNSVGMSVEPWMLACPRRARIPPPGRPMLPSSSWMIDAARLTAAQLHPVRAVSLLARDVRLLLGRAGGRLTACLVVAPPLDPVGAVVGIPAGEETARVLRVPEVRVDDHRPVRVVLHVL